MDMDSSLYHVADGLAAANVSLNVTANDTLLGGATTPTPARIARLQLANQISLAIICTSMMVGMGCAITLDEIKMILRRPWGVLIGVFSQYGILPLCSFTLAHVLQLHPAYAIGMLVVSCSPGGMASNLLTYYVEGDITLSICMTTCSTFLAFGLMPLCLFIYSKSWSSHKGVPAIPYMDITIALVTILVPVVVGMVIRRKCVKGAAVVSKVGGVLGMVGIVVSLTLQGMISSAPYRSSVQLWFAACVLPIVGFALSYLFAYICKMGPAQRRTVGIETGMQNVGVALTVMAMSFKDAGPMVKVFPAVYALVQSLFTLTVVPMAVSYQKVWSKYKLQIRLVPREPSETAKKLEATEEKKVGNGHGNGIPSLGDPRTMYRLVSHTESVAMEFDGEASSSGNGELGESRV